MKTRIFFLLMMLCLSLTISAQDSSPKRLTGNRKYQIIVNEDPTGENTRGIKWQDQNRGFVDYFYSAYRSTFAGKLTSAATGIIDLGISFLYNKIANHRNDWMQAVQKECSYTKNLSMQTDIVDFYKKPSKNGAMDPEGIVFSGFGCRQSIDVNESNNATSHAVFYIHCKLRTDSLGIARIVNHSKFEVEVDSIYFDPYNCNLPNDSTTDLEKRILFDFAKRKDLTLSLTATITSSWMNEAIQIYQDVKLGEFKVTAKIDQEDLVNNVFTYNSEHDKNSRKAKKISVTGESFLVPRSYVGTPDGITFENTWGTGQYKIEMQVNETCSINQDYYLDRSVQGGKQGGPIVEQSMLQQQDQPSDVQLSGVGQGGSAMSQQGAPLGSAKQAKQKWNDKWKEEWKIISKRKNQSSFWKDAKDAVVTEWDGKQWLTTIIEPISTAITNINTEVIGGEQSGMGGDKDSNPMSSGMPH